MRRDEQSLFPFGRLEAKNGSMECSPVLEGVLENDVSDGGSRDNLFSPSGDGKVQALRPRSNDGDDFLAELLRRRSDADSVVDDGVGALGEGVDLQERDGSVSPFLRRVRRMREKAFGSKQDRP